MMNYNTNIQQQQIGRGGKYEVNTAEAHRGFQGELGSLDCLEKNKKVLVSDKEISERAGRVKRKRKNQV